MIMHLFDTNSIQLITYSHCLIFVDFKSVFQYWYFKDNYKNTVGRKLPAWLPVPFPNSFISIKSVIKTPPLRKCSKRERERERERAKKVLTDTLKKQTWHNATYRGNRRPAFDVLFSLSRRKKSSLHHHQQVHFSAQQVRNIKTNFRGAVREGQRERERESHRCPSWAAVWSEVKRDRPLPVVQWAPGQRNNNHFPAQ